MSDEHDGTLDLNDAAAVRPWDFDDGEPYVREVGLLARSEQADDLPHARMPAERYADHVLRKLAAYARGGLPACYAPAEQWWYDFWPDLPWNEPGQRAVVAAMRSHPEWEAVAWAFEERTGLQLRRVLAESGL